MGRYITPTPAPIYSNSLDISTNEAIAARDLVEMDAITGKASRVRTTDCAAVPTVIYGTAQTSAATGMIVAQTEVINNQTQAYSRQAVVHGADGSIFTLTNGSASVGMKLNKYSPAGALLGTVAVDTANSYVNHHLLLLSNGNLACMGQYTGAQKYAVYNQALAAVKGITAMEVPSDAHFSAVSLSAGGFAAVYQQGANPLLARLTTFDNSGTEILTPTTIWTRTGTAGTQYSRIAQLSDGNLAIAATCTSGTGSTGLNHGVFTTGGDTVLAFVNKDATAGGYMFPEISVLPGYYCISKPNGTNQLAFVFNNSGTLQGAGFTAATSAGNSLNKTKLVSDGTAFWLIWARSSDGSVMVTKIPATGSGYVTTVLTAASYNQYLDAFCENGAICYVTMDGSTNTRPYLWVVNTTLMSLVFSSNTPFGVAPSTASGSFPRIIPGGDSSFIVLYDYQSTPATNLCLGKYANTAIIGVANANASAGALCNVSQNSGAYSCNAIGGSPAKAFDMSSTPALYGNKGTVMNNGVVLKGM